MLAFESPTNSVRIPKPNSFGKNSQLLAARVRGAVLYFVFDGSNHKLLDAFICIRSWRRDEHIFLRESGGCATAGKLQFVPALVNTALS
jgi:hypothetical protein